MTAKTNEWIMLKEGNFQVIDLGNGIVHSEELFAKSEVFQIWLDPNINISLQRLPKYRDYPSEAIPINKNKKISIEDIVGGKSAIELETKNNSIQEISLEMDYQCILNCLSTYSIYILKSELIINENEVKKDDFIVIQDEEEIHINCKIKSKIFMITFPKKNFLQNTLETDLLQG